jgi:hypothetical protein
MVQDDRSEKIRVILITLIFAVHKNNWKFMEEFICHQGLVFLVDMLLDENLYIRGQVVDIFLAAFDGTGQLYFVTDDSLHSIFITIK